MKAHAVKKVVEQEFLDCCFGQRIVCFALSNPMSDSSIIANPAKYGFVSIHDVGPCARFNRRGDEEERREQ